MAAILADIFKHIFVDENVRISFKISLESVLKGSIDNKSALIPIMAWCRSGDKPFSEPMMVFVTEVYMNVNTLLLQVQYMRHLASMS